MIAVQKFGRYAHIERLLYEHSRNEGNDCWKRLYLVVESGGDAGKGKRRTGAEQRRWTSDALDYIESARTHHEPREPSPSRYHPMMHSIV